MRRFAVLTALSVLAGAAPAAADTFGEQPFDSVAGVATCLRATGAPGELARWVPGGVELLQAGPAGVQPAGVVRLGARPDGCPVVAAAPTGAAVAAQLTSARGAAALRVAVRAPGGRFGPARTIGHVNPPPGTELHVAVSPAGDAVVAATEVLLGRRSRARVIVVRRGAGSGFGAPEVLESRPFGRVPDVAAGIDAAGDATVVWQLDGAVAAASAPRDGRFGAPQHLGATETPPALAETPDGRALVVWTTPFRVRAAERAPAHRASGRRWRSAPAAPAASTRARR